MARARSNQSWRLVNVALLASSASARTISLSSFELISSIFITPACLDAYNTPLQGCELNDFLLGRECSRTCITDLQSIEATIQEACSAANPRAGTLLSRTKDGDLVAALCGTEPVDDDDGGQQITTTTQLEPGFPSRTTTVTKAITPKPAPTTTTTIEREPPPPATTEESSTEVAEETSARLIDPPRSSESSSSSSSSSSSEPESTQPAPTLPPVRSTSSPSQPAVNTAVPDDDGNDDFDGRPPGSGGGGLEDVGFEASGMSSRPSLLAVVAAIAGAVMMVSL